MSHHCGYAMQVSCIGPPSSCGMQGRSESSVSISIGAHQLCGACNTAYTASAQAQCLQILCHSLKLLHSAMLFASSILHIQGWEHSSLAWLDVVTCLHSDLPLMSVPLEQLQAVSPCWESALRAPAVSFLMYQMFVRNLKGNGRSAADPSYLPLAG